jgi:dihydroorotase
VNVLIKNTTILCKGNKHHGKKRDVLIENGIIVKIGASLSASKSTKIIEAKDAYLAPSFFDLFAHANDPGTEHKETIETLAAAALAGGYTDVCILPNTNPTVSNKAQVQYVINKGHHTNINVWPLGAVSAKLQGKDLAEMLDMHHSGAIAFTDGLTPVQNAGLLLKALQYVKAFDGTIIQMPLDASINSKGLMNEGKVSTQLGMLGLPAIAEEIIIARDIELAAYAESKIHFSGITTAKSIDLITKAKKRGVQITCSVSPYHLLFTDEALVEYDSNYKVMPPLRTDKDRKALVAALASGNIDAIASHHQPQDWDCKNVEFEYAQSGMSTLQTCLLSLLPLVKEGVALENIAHALGNGARASIGQNIFKIEEGEEAHCVLFTQSGITNFEENTWNSLGKNSPYINQTLNGKIIAVINKNKYIAC